jgi:hemerythrin-like metal-binding protein/PAS domain S-box-containing protein
MNIKANELLESLPAILEASTEAIASVDSVGRILGFNPQFRLLLGLSDEQVRGVNISEFFKSIDTKKIGVEIKDDYEASLLTKKDGSTLWVLIRIMPVGTTEFGHYTLLVQEPESVRRIIDRLDYVENYDLSTGLLNSRKGIIEFEQLQMSNLSGGCFLLQIETVQDEKHLDKYIKSIAKHLLSTIKNGFTSRYSSTEILSVYTCDNPLPLSFFSQIIERIRNGLSMDLNIEIAHIDWQSGTLSVNTIVDTLKESLSPVAADDLLDNIKYRRSFTPEHSFISRLHDALESGELVFYIQPQISSETRQVIGGELLIRWVMPSGKIVQPSEFVIYLEQGEFATKFFEWSVKTSIEILIQLNTNLDLWMPLSLNLAPSHISDTGLIDYLIKHKKIHQIPDRVLEVEITERILADDQVSTHRNLELLAANGINIAIDDFGTGYSSLSYLRQFSLDRLKIDRVFVTNLDENEEDRLIVNSIISLAHVLGLEVIAEGVEEPFQADFLKDLNCEYFQGYLTGKAMPVDKYVDFVRDNLENCAQECAPTDFLTTRYLDKQPKAIKWKKSFSTDVVSVDNEHRALIDALNQFADQYHSDPQSVDIVQALDLVASEAIKHFEHEEQVMFNIGYPRYQSHKEKHEWLIADICKRRNELKTNTEDFEEILKYLKYWLMRHLVSEDTHLHRHINQIATDRRH